MLNLAVMDVSELMARMAEPNPFEPLVLAAGEGVSLGRVSSAVSTLLEGKSGGKITIDKLQSNGSKDAMHLKTNVGAGSVWVSIRDVLVSSGDGENAKMEKTGEVEIELTNTFLVNASDLTMIKGILTLDAVKQELKKTENKGETVVEKAPAFQLVFPSEVIDRLEGNGKFGRMALCDLVTDLLIERSDGKITRGNNGVADWFNTKFDKENNARKREVIVFSFKTTIPGAKLFWMKISERDTTVGKITKIELTHVSSVGHELFFGRNKAEEVARLNVWKMVCEALDTPKLLNKMAVRQDSVRGREKTGRNLRM
ncbi:Uncharacterised protein [Candidatus Gugararchaeum adminiculabundum]|nr:Uncharacterised protein [Candidatus Gugararchaeum adminiculabundum]